MAIGGGGMAMSKNRQILLVIDSTNPHQRKIAQGVATYAHEKGNWTFHVVQDSLENLPYLTQDPFESRHNIDAWRFDGSIAHFHSKKTAAIVQRLGIPVVAIEPECGWRDPKWQIPWFTTDNKAIGRLVAQDFVERGLNRLAFCGIPRTDVTGWSEDRQTAFEQYARDVGVPCSVFLGDSPEAAKSDKLSKRLAAWLESLEKPVGLMACYDVRARHVLMTCRSLGLLVPEDVAIIGVDNDELMCELTNPPLSSVEQGSRRIGYESAALLDQLMAGRKSPQLRFSVEPEGIVSRHSSDTLAIKDVEVAAALLFIRQHACEGIQVPDVVRTIAISRSALEMRFKAVAGRTIHTEIQRVQIERARQLITATDLPLKDVATEAGFRYLQHMTTLFRLHVGQTPSEYRKRSRV
jgi:LacI family transcriptional regulator